MNIHYPSISQFKQFVELKDYRAPTKKEYVRNVCKLAEHFQCDPATLSENQLRQYFLFLRQHKHYKAPPMKAAKYALLSFYLDHLKVSGWTVFKEVRIAEPQVLPIVLSRAEVHALLGAVREPRFRTALRLIYHCGLRVGEAPTIRIVLQSCKSKRQESSTGLVQPLIALTLLRFAQSVKAILVSLGRVVMTELLSL